MSVSITHVYDDYGAAERTIEALEEAGVTADQISVVGRPGDGQTVDVPGGAATGATLGGVAGAGAGVLAAIGVIAIPGIGPLIAAGVIATTLAGAAAGAAAGGLVGALVDYGISEEDAPIYAESVRRGGTLVSVRVPKSRAEEIEAIMKRHDPIDIDSRAQAYRAAGWTGYDPHAEAYTPAQAEAERKRYVSSMVTLP